jgi:hypothetical protein
MVLERPRERETWRKGQEVRETFKKRGREGGPCERPEASLERVSVGFHIFLPETLIELFG